MLTRLLSSNRGRWLLVAVFLACFAAIRAGAPDERDPYWSARAGLETLAGLPLARPDTWSWSHAGEVWFQNSPGWNVFLGFAWQAGGFWGLFWLTFLSLTALFFVAAVLARRLGAKPLQGLAGFLVVIAATVPMLSPRATVVVQTLLLFAVWLGATLMPRVAAAPPWVALPAVGVAGLVLSTVGNWLHLSFVVMAPAIALMWAVQWLTLPGVTLGRRAAFAAVGAAGLAGGVLLTPYGLAETLRQSAKTQAECAGLIGEWAAVWDMSALWWARAAVCMLVAAAAIWLLVRIWKVDGWRSDTFRIAAPLTMVAAPAAAAGLFSVRFLGVSLLAMLPVAGWMATVGLDAAKGAAARSGRGLLRLLHVRGYTEAKVWTAVLALTVVFLAPFTMWKASAGGRPDEQGVIDLLPVGCKLFSPAPVAGPVILTRPDVKVWQDGRADFYGRASLIESYRIMAGVSSVPAGATCVIIGDSTVDPLYPRAVTAMDADRRWRRAAVVNHFILWLPR